MVYRCYRCLISSKTVEISRAKFHEIQKTNNAHDVTMTSNMYRFCWKQALTTLLIVYMIPLCIYTQFLYILWFISSNEIHQQITNVSVNNCIYFKYSLCTLNILSIIRLIMMSLWRHSAPNFTERYIFWKFVYITIKLVNCFYSMSSIIVYMRPLYTQYLYISWFISSNEIHQ
jgi:hypothetical protein